MEIESGNDVMRCIAILICIIFIITRLHECSSNGEETTISYRVARTTLKQENRRYFNLVDVE